MSIWAQYTIYITVVVGAYWFGYFMGAKAALARCHDVVDRHFNNN